MSRTRARVCVVWSPKMSSFLNLLLVYTILNWCKKNDQLNFQPQFFPFFRPPFSSCLCLDSLLVTEAEDWTMIQVTEDTRTEVEARQSTTAANTDSSTPHESGASKMQAYVVLHWSCYIQSTYKYLYNDYTHYVLSQYYKRQMV